MFKTTFRSLNYTSYRFFFFGQGISLIGTWMQEIAVGWMIYRLTGSPFLLGAVGFCQNIPVLLLAPLAGAFVDRINKKRFIIINQFFAFLLALSLGVMTYFHYYYLPLIFTIITLMGIIMAIDMPARQAFLNDIIEDPKDLPNAIALNSSLVHIARLIGPSLGGILIAAWDESICYLFNALSFLIVFFALFFIKPHSRLQVNSEKKFFHNFKEGFSYSWNHQFIRAILFFVIVITILGMIHPVLLPIYTREILHGDSKILGMLMALGGVGSLFGALALASRKTTHGLVKRTSLMVLIFGTAFIGLAFSRNIYLSCMILMISGAAFTFALSSSNSLVQLSVDNHMRGRVMGIYTQCFKGMTPFGHALAGSFAGTFGVCAAFVFSGIMAIIAGAYFWRRKEEV